MKRTPTKKKTARGKIDQTHTKKKSKLEKINICENCSTGLFENDRALFVEEEIGRIFCSEACIANYFNPDIEILEKEYFRFLPSNDLSDDERDRYAHLKWMTLQKPDELWCQKTLVGDSRYTLISEFQPGSGRIWFICICLFLKEQPSFLLLAFPTRSVEMVNHYRKGEKLIKKNKASDHSVVAVEEKTANPVDRLAEEWTEDETFRAQFNQERSEDDIQFQEYGKYQNFLEETLETPDEVWSLSVQMGGALKLYHFIKYYPDQNNGIWFLVVARETENEEEIELLDAFPTRNLNLVEHYRTGKLEVETRETQSISRIVH
jgi:hypothetical protein